MQSEVPKPLSELTLNFDEFGQRRLRRAVDGQGRTLESLLVDSLAHFDAATQEHRVAAIPPRFLSERSSAALSIRLATSTSSLEALRGEAQRRRLPVERLVEHSVLLYLADVETAEA